MPNPNKTNPLHKHDNKLPNTENIREFVCDLLLKCPDSAFFDAGGDVIVDNEGNGIIRILCNKGDTDVMISFAAVKRYPYNVECNSF